MSKGMVVLEGLFLAVLVLLAACTGGEGVGPKPTPSADVTESSPVPTPTVTQTPVALAPPVPLPEGDHTTQDGGYLADVRAGQLWRLPGWGGIWSPDGRTLLAIECCLGDGGLDLITVPVGPVVRIFDGDVASAAWSPDGNRIAFSPDAAGPKGLYLVDKDGTGLKQLSDVVDAWTISWSPRGDYVAFRAGESATYLVPVAGGEAQLIGRFWHFAWSPDSKSLALAGEAGLELYDVDTGEARMLAAGPAGGPLLWSPDGSKIILSYGEMIPWPFMPESTYQRLYVVDIAGQGEPVLLGDIRSPQWSPDGQRIAYLSRGCVTEDWNIYTMLADGSSKVALTDTPQAAKEGPFWSPTGSAIAFSTFDKLLTVDANSGEVRTITVSDTHPRSGLHVHGGNWGDSPWSPDGRYLLFHVGGDHGICT